jgi:hypothetical protein
MKNAFFLITFSFMGLSMTSSAHPGHGMDNGYSLFHYLTSPLHVFVLLILSGGLVFFLYRKMVKQKQ